MSVEAIRKALDGKDNPDSLVKVTAGDVMAAVKTIREPNQVVKDLSKGSADLFPHQEVYIAARDLKHLLGAAPHDE